MTQAQSSGGRPEWRLAAAGISPVRAIAAAAVGVTMAIAASGCVIVIDGGGDGVSWSNREDTRPRIGVETGTPGRALATQLGVDADKTVVVTRVVGGSPADRAGLRRYDVIIQIDGDDNASGSRLRKAVREKAKGETLSLRILREGKPLDVVVSVERPGEW